jgi:hypothetical protein
VCYLDKLTKSEKVNSNRTGQKLRVVKINNKGLLHDKRVNKRIQDSGFPQSGIAAHRRIMTV